MNEGCGQEDSMEDRSAIRTIDRECSRKVGHGALAWIMQRRDTNIISLAGRNGILNGELW